MSENLQKLYCIRSDIFSWNAEIAHLLQLLKETEKLLIAAKMQKFWDQKFTAFIQDAEILHAVKPEENCWPSIT